MLTEIKNNIVNIYKHYLVSIRNYTKDKPTLGCILKIILRGPTREFQEYVARYVPTKKINGYMYETRNFSVVSLGAKNPNQIIVYLERDSGAGGFCAEWIYWLNRLAFADRIGASFCINWTSSQFYKENGKVKSTDNIFEYYFKQPSAIQVKDALKSQNVIIDANIIDYGYYDIFAPGRADDYKIQPSDIEIMALLQRKYIRLNQELAEEIECEITNMLGDLKVLAVHARGADANIPYNNHPIPVKAKVYIEKTKEQADRLAADKIFLATDDNHLLETFVKAFGEKLIYYKDVERSDGFRMNCYGEGARPLHHYHLGREIIRDVYTMANCQGFVCSHSYVSYIVQILKKSFNQNFETLFCINTAFRKKGWNLADPNTIRKVEKIWNKELQK